MLSSGDAPANAAGHTEMDESRWVLLYGSERIRAVTPPTGLSPADLLKAPSRRLRHPWARPCCPVGTRSTRMTLELTRRMDAPNRGRDLSLYAMLFQEVTANRSDPQTGRPGDNSRTA
ncbi:hypothetical protein ROHU_031195 [Labeo rohita]|uniref:Uncharacterized protein n=1 Tax=Labeo rohita TaxID=84645 RepID=A0A498LQH3_LABRO|nr:hypothetical protein ROHU_011093 [Labeo rohita]RXN09815.1 hypothetical protein ROHU_031195 [Labeo rohita]